MLKIRHSLICASVVGALCVPWLHAQSIIFSEIMYHPPGENQMVDNGDEYEFLELYNTGASAVDLSGAVFTDGISYTFPNSTSLAPGGYLVLARNPTAFEDRYDSTPFGAYDGSLANGGERVKLETAGGSTLFSVNYGDSAPWPTQPDGYGSSLLLKNFYGDPDIAANWCASAAYLGTPGETGTCFEASVVINEVLAHTDLPDVDSIELFNPTASPIDIGNWYLSDNGLKRKKYRIPPGTTIDANSYLVFDESEFNDLADIHSDAFALSELGEEVFLTAADANSNLTDTVDFVFFGATENGVSVGRYPNGSGDLVIQAENSLGAANGLPRVGPVVISEVMYHPVNDVDDAEYIELLNISDSEQPLYDPAVPTNTWKLDNAVEFLFPTGLVMAAGERLLLVGTTNVNAFRSTYNLSPTVQVVGAWSGNLSNGGETIELYKPGNPETNLVPYILVDLLRYDDEGGWPTAPDGNGPSLERVTNTNFGNDVENWFSGGPGGSPGVAPVAGLLNPQILPAFPLPGNVFTATVSVVADVLPTQIVVEAASPGGVTNTYHMNDDGTGADLTAGDQIYSAELPAQSDGTRLYYRYVATGASGRITLPAETIDYLPPIPVRFSLCSSGLATNVTPGDSWETIQTVGTVASSNCFLFIHAGEAGEFLVDDITIDDAGGTNRIRNPSFDEDEVDPDPWQLRGNHSNSYLDADPQQPSNTVMRVVANGSGLRWYDEVRQYIWPELDMGETVTLSFRIRRASRNIVPWLWVEVGSLQPDVVINEIMYHPASSTDEMQREYVELYNPGSATFDLTGWCLDGTAFAFPPSSIGAGEYLVVCSDTATVQSVYGITNAVGNWRGQLQNGGETLTLIDSFWRTVDTVDYSDGGSWPPAADGYGPSLERYHYTLPGTSSVSWTSSRASTNWIPISWTSTVSEANSGIRLFLDYEGMVWVDDLSVTHTGGSANLVNNGDFEADMAGWITTNNHSQSRIEPQQGRGGSSALALFATQSRIATYGDALERYGDAETNCVFSIPLDTVNGTSYVVSGWVRRQGVAAGNVWMVMDGVSNRVDLSMNGTPGRENSRMTPQTPLAILDLDRYPQVALPGSPITVRAELNRADATDIVELGYRMVTSNQYQFTDANYTNLTMLDDGMAPDTVAGDGIYAVSIPGDAPAYSFVRYHVRAAATNGFIHRSPDADDLSVDRACWVASGPIITTIPNWHVFVDGPPIIYPINRKACLVSPQGQVLTDVELRHRGRPDPWNVERTGLAARFHRSRPLDAWFANNQSGINFRQRRNDSSYYYRRVVNEMLGYQLQSTLNLPTPRVRHVLVWFDGDPTVTIELEDPGEDFAKDNGIDNDDYLSRSGYTGRRLLAGNEALDNFETVTERLQSIVDGETAYSELQSEVRALLDYESVQYTMALLGCTGNADQNLEWNMFQHRRADDGRWRHFPWDVDMSFATNNSGAFNTQNMHPYYQTPLHGDFWNTNNYRLLGSALFYPESGSGAEYSLPFRYRQQKTLWRLSQTVFTTNFLGQKLDAMVDTLGPVYDQIYNREDLTDTVTSIKQFIEGRREFLFNGDWSDRDPSIWSAPAYETSGIVINEILVDAEGSGEYIELYNRNTQSIDLSSWTLTLNEDTYRLPFGAVLAPSNYLVVADSPRPLTNAFVAISDPATMVRRTESSSLWDFPMTWTNAEEYATRMVHVDNLSLPNTGAVVSVYDLTDTLIDTITYTSNDWSIVPGVSLELVDADTDNRLPAVWQLSTQTGTPAMANSTMLDKDHDGIPDLLEQAVIDADHGDAILTIADVLPGDDFDADGISNHQEFILGTDLTVADTLAGGIDIFSQDNGVTVEIQTHLVSGQAYSLYTNRLYSLQHVPLMHSDASWTNLPGMTFPATGSLVIITNHHPGAQGYYRFRVDLEKIR